MENSPSINIAGCCISAASHRPFAHRKMKICMSSLYCVRSTSKVDASDAWQPVAWHSNQTIHTSSYSLCVIITPLDTNAHTSERARVHIRMNGGVRSKSTQAFGWFFFFFACLTLPARCAGWCLLLLVLLVPYDVPIIWNSHRLRQLFILL